MRQYTGYSRHGSNIVHHYFSSIQRIPSTGTALRCSKTRFKRFHGIGVLVQETSTDIINNVNINRNHQYLYKQQQQQQYKRWQSSTSSTGTTTNGSIRSIKYLDLRGSGLSILERLCLEECLYMKDVNNDWIIVGYHDANEHRFFQSTNKEFTKPIYGPNVAAANSSDDDNDEFDNVGNPNSSVAIILGIGGKPNELLNIDAVQKDSVVCIKRFTGGGTVVVDSDCIWISIIGRTNGGFFNNNNPDDDDNNNKNQTKKRIEFYPRPIMQWTADSIYIPFFEQLQQLQNQKQTNLGHENLNNDDNNGVDNLQKTLVLDTKSCAVENTGKVIQIKHHYLPKSTKSFEETSTSVPKIAKQQERPPTFELRENDYVMVWKDGSINNNSNDDDDTSDTKIRKMGGNAQAIGKSGFIHHTSFLWTYEQYNMEHYLTLPSKRPTYRSDRSHTDFLIQLQTIFPNLSKRDFIAILSDTCTKQFNGSTSNNKADGSKNNPYQQVTIQETMKIINSITNGQGLQGWYEQSSRNKIVTDL